MDRYFELEQKNHDPEIIWKWLKNLNFHNSKNEKDSVAVKVLQEKDELRQGILRLLLHRIMAKIKIMKLLDLI